MGINPLEVVKGPDLSRAFGSSMLSGYWRRLPLLLNTRPGRGERQIMFIREEKQVAFWLPATRGLPS